VEFVYFLVFIVAIFVAAYWIYKGEEELKAKVERAKERLKHDQSPAAKQAFTDVSRAYYAYKRQDGKPTVYDEQRIANDLQGALPHPVPTIDNYNDRRTFLSVEQAVIQPDGASPAQIQRGIMGAITNSSDGCASIPEIMAIVAASQDEIEIVLGKLSLKGLVKITNRLDGSICYCLDDL
jgi:hypothetical protein